MQIYILEDNPQFIHEFEKFLRNRNHEFVFCNTIEAFDFLKTPDFFVIDLQIGDKKSFEVIRKIRETQDTFIVVLTHLTDSEILSYTIEYGADYIINKLDTEMYGLHFDIVEKLISKRKQ